jgi:hypothetical protein
MRRGEDLRLTAKSKPAVRGNPLGGGGYRVGCATARGRGPPRAQNRAARLRTLPGIAARFCTPYEFCDAVVLGRERAGCRGAGGFTVCL